MAFREQSNDRALGSSLGPRAGRGTTNSGPGAAGKDARREKHEVTAKKLLCGSTFFLSPNKSPQSRF